MPLGIPLLAVAEVGAAEGLFVALRPQQAADVFAPTGRSLGAWTTRADDS